MPVLPGMPVITRRFSPGLILGLIHATSFGFGATAVSTQQPLERVVEVPVIDDVLVVPHDLAGVGVQAPAWSCGTGSCLSLPPSMYFGAGDDTDVPM